MHSLNTPTTKDSMIFLRSHATLRKYRSSRSFSTNPPVADDFFSERGCLYLAGYHLPQSVKDSLPSLPPQVRPIYATKIGCVEGGHEQVEKRKKSFQTGSPFPFKMTYVSPCRYQYQVESIWKNHFQPKLVGNGAGTEWFHLDDSDIQFVTSEMETYESTGMLLGHDIANEQAVAPVRKSSADERKEQPAKQSHRNQVKAILSKHKELSKRFHRRSYLSASDFKVVFAALCKHTRSAEKRGRGVAEIFVSKSPFVADEWSFCFYVKRIDGSEEDFSYKKCFSSQPRRDLRGEGLEEESQEEEVLEQDHRDGTLVHAESRAVPELARLDTPGAKGTSRDHGKPVLAASQDVLKLTAFKHPNTSSATGPSDLDRVEDRQSASIDAEHPSTARSEARERVEAILWKHICIIEEDCSKLERSYLTLMEFVAVLAALDRHPTSKKKIGCGVAEIFVARSPYNGGRTFSFYVERKDGSEDIFSYAYCF